MSQENVEVIRQAVEAFDRRDRGTWLETLDEDYEIAPAGDWPEARAIRGGEAGWNFYLDIAQTLSLGSAHVEFLDAGGDKVFAHQWHEGRGWRSGADVEVEYWRVITFREGKILRDQWFTDRADALEAAGLRE
jgi:ketosteroid isomerase-like protein